MKTKICFKCGIAKPISQFYHHPQMLDGRLGKCKICTKKDVHERRIVANDYYNDFDRERYRTNILRMWKLKYNSMRRRVLGINKHSNLLGKGLMSKTEFLPWCESTRKDFMVLYSGWEDS